MSFERIVPRLTPWHDEGTKKFITLLMKLKCCLLTSLWKKKLRCRENNWIPSTKLRGRENIWLQSMYWKTQKTMVNLGDRRCTER